MRNFRAPLAAIATAFLAACSTGSESGVNGGQLFVRSCSLGCSDGASGVQVSCQVQSTVQNTDISVLFSEPVDINTVTSTTFRVVNVDNGTTPVGEYFLDPNDPRRVVFRPALTFDINGTPSFGFSINTPYQVTIPGELHSANGPFIQSIVGRPNQSRLDCTIVTTDQITDPVPGPPVVEIYADYVTAYSGGLPTEINRVTDAFGVFDGVGTDGLSDNLVNGSALLSNVYRQGSIYFLFRDVMNPATLANPVTMTSPFITVRTDEDGSLATTFDRSDPIPGQYRVSVDTELLQTLLTFTPNNPLLSAGAGAPGSPRLTVVDVPQSVRDLDGKVVTVQNGGGLSVCVTEVGMVTDIELPQAGGEDFSDNTLEDGNRSGGAWGTNSRLATNLGGGSGRLGELIVRAGETVILNTDSQTFPLGSVVDLIGNPNMSGLYPTSITVTDGVFEFSSMVIEPGGTLRLEGSNPARILVRGLANVTTGSVIDLTGQSMPTHASDTPQPAVDLPPMLTPPANGGLGGFGADKWDFDPVGVGMNPSVFTTLTGNAVDIDEAVPENNNGRDGQGVGGTGLGAGRGALMAFTNFPTEDEVIIDPISVTGAHGANPPFNRNENFITCVVRMVGPTGSGGAYARDGGDGVALSPSPTATEPMGASNHAPTTTGGQASDLSLAAPDEFNAGYTVRTLDWTLGFLRGGSGGGGGGLHPYQTESGNNMLAGCGPSDTLGYDTWMDHSGASGGGGGGALDLVAGKTIQVNGQILLNGGDGGSSTGGNLGFARFAAPGGGGSGGALRLRANNISISPLPGRIDVQGGDGGVGSWATTDVLGGDGSPGLVRIENAVGGQTHQAIAPSIRPFEGDGMAPFDALDKSLDFLSVANNFVTLPTRRPDSVCASTSCWIELPPGFSVASFKEDDVELGWDMDVIWQVGANPEELISYRAPSTPFPAGFETTNGNHLGPDGAPASPVVVRFQGGRVTEPLANPCNVSVTAGDSPIQFGSLTPWVRHPAELNAYGSNVVRFCIIFDNTVEGGDNPGAVLANVRGVTNLSIRAAAE